MIDHRPPWLSINNLIVDNLTPSRSSYMAISVDIKRGKTVKTFHNLTLCCDYLKTTHPTLKKAMKTGHRLNGWHVIDNSLPISD